MPIARNESGFALLITLVIVGVVLAIGLSLLEITVKQILLSSTARDSEVSFHASNTGLECAMATWLDLDFVTDGAIDITFDCIDTAPAQTVSPVVSARTYAYTGAEFTWTNGAQDLCTQVDLYILDARPASGVGGDYTETFSDQGLESKTCAEGDVCAVIFSRGYNRDCSNLTSLRTVQRELTIDF